MNHWHHEVIDSARVKDIVMGTEAIKSWMVSQWAVFVCNAIMCRKSDKHAHLSSAKLIVPLELTPYK